MQWLGTLAFESRKKFRPLQAADINAYTGFRTAELWWVDRLNEKQRLFGKMWDRAALTELREEVVQGQFAGIMPYVVKRKGDAK